jgi:hypothetical protein
VAGLSAYYAIRQASHDLSRQSQWIQSVYSWFKRRSLAELGLSLAIVLFFVGLGLILLVWLSEKPLQSTAPVVEAVAEIKPTAVDTVTSPPIATPMPQPIIVVMNQEGTRLSVSTPTTEPKTTAPQILTPEVTLIADVAESAATPCTDLHWNVVPVNPTDVVAVRFRETKMKLNDTIPICNGTPGPHLLQIDLSDGQTVIYTATIVTQPTVTATATPTAPYIQFTDDIQSVPLYATPIDGISEAATLIDGPLVAQLRIDAQSSDGRWYRVCCFTLNENEDVPLWLNNTAIVTNKAAVANVTPIVAPTRLPPLPFDRAIGPEYHATGSELLRILVKVYTGDSEPLGGYLLHVRFLPKGQTQWINRPNSSPQQNGNGDTVSQTQYVNTPGGAYNYKFEFQPQEATLGEGTWEFWLSNAEHDQLSAKESFYLAPGNPNHEIYIGWKRVR